jgi:GGDEF domain-containing protein
VKEPIYVEDKTVHIETSIGITVSGNASDAKGLIGIADKAMYKAKRQKKRLCLLTRTKQIYK